MTLNNYWFGSPIKSIMAFLLSLYENVNNFGKIIAKCSRYFVFFNQFWKAAKSVNENIFKSKQLKPILLRSNIKKIF